MHTLLQENEIQANRYTTQCLLITSGIVAITWLLNIIGFFIVDKTTMNIVMPIALASLIYPYFVDKYLKITHPVWKYFIMFSLVFGITILSSALTLQVLLAWTLPIIMSCHYYSKKFTTFSLILTLLAMLAAFYVGILIGVWDANIMRSSDAVNTFAERMAHINFQKSVGDNVFLRGFNFYYIPRAGIVLIFYATAMTLCKRSSSLISKNYTITMEKERIGAELSVATNIQASMLPSIFPAFPTRTEFDIYAKMIPAKEVGGDFYDFFLIDDDHLGLVVADVSGKGVPAALFMVIAKTLIKNSALSNITSPSKILEKVNNQLCEGNDANMFVTTWLGIYEISTKKLTASNAGHEYPVIKRKNGNFELFKEEHGFVLGGMTDLDYTDYEVALEEGDTFFIYSDGVPEATDINNNMYGEEKMLASLNAHKDEELEQLLEKMKTDIDTFVDTAPQFDDITMLALKIK